jgi:hypothetical protein
MTIGRDRPRKTRRRQNKLLRTEAFRLTRKLVWHWFLLGRFPDLELAGRLSGSDKISDSQLTLGEIARRFGAAYEARHGHRMRPEELRTLRALAACRTAVCGWHRYRCDQCGHVVVVYNSCGDGHCPGCQNAKRARWLDQRRGQLLPVPYFHTIVPLPRELSRLALYNRRLIYDLLFLKAAETLKQVAASHGMARIGFFAVLHTWGQKLSGHVHLHIVVVGGGLSADGKQWTTARDNFFLPVPTLRLVFRAKMLEALLNAYEAGQLHFDGKLKHLAKRNNFLPWWGRLLQKNWVVHVKPPFGDTPDLVLKYLARYVYRVGISNGRLLELNDDQVTFSYRDYSEPGYPEKQMTLSVDQFLGRFLQHVMPRGFMRVRHFGFLGGPSAAQQLGHIRRLIDAQSRTRPSAATERDAPIDNKDDLRSDADSESSWLVCPKCGVGPLREVEAGARQQCRELWPVLWSLFPSWSVQAEDSS